MEHSFKRSRTQHWIDEAARIRREFLDPIERRSAGEKTSRVSGSEARHQVPQTTAGHQVHEDQSYPRAGA